MQYAQAACVCSNLPTDMHDPDITSSCGCRASVAKNRAGRAERLYCLGRLMRGGLLFLHGPALSTNPHHADGFDEPAHQCVPISVDLGIVAKKACWAERRRPSNPGRGDGHPTLLLPRLIHRPQRADTVPHTHFHPLALVQIDHPSPDIKIQRTCG